VLRKSLTAAFCCVVLLAMAGNALALSRTAKAPTSAKKKVVSNVTVTGPSVKCHQWGFMQVQLQVQKTVVTTAGGKPKVTIKITGISWPIYPDHTPKSKYINAQALPLLQQETMSLQASAGTKLEHISGATHTSVSWLASLQAALLKAETP
jgi:uncharacterized protein with FMN-binding domain